MSLFVEFRLEIPLLSTTMEAAPDARAVIKQQTRTTNGRLKLTVAVEGEGEALSAFESGLEADETVESFTRLGGNGHSTYQVALSEAGAAVTTYDCWAEMDAVFLDAERYRKGWEIRMCFHDRDSFQRYAEFCEDEGLSFSLRRISGLDEHFEEETEDDLTDLQTESLVYAFNEGYYSVQRETSLQELAESMDVSHQALSERLRRGVGSLVDNTLAQTEQDEDSSA